MTPAQCAGDRQDAEDLVQQALFGRPSAGPRLGSIPALAFFWATGGSHAAFSRGLWLLDTSAVGNNLMSGRALYAAVLRRPPKCRPVATFWSTKPRPPGFSVVARESACARAVP